MCLAAQTTIGLPCGELLSASGRFHCQTRAPLACQLIAYMQRCVLIPRSAYPAWLPAKADAINGILIVVSSEGLCSVSLLDYTGYTR
jgi:hypothetical protein